MAKIEKDVGKFLDLAGDKYGQIAAERFSQDMFCEFGDLNINSPIEQMFYVALHLLCFAECVEVSPGPVLDCDGKWQVGKGVHITPQKKIGKYRVDFLVSQEGLGPVEKYPPVVVELDGHAFHDRDKHQRSYEKARDRFLAKSGYTVFHFTGGDVVSDPFVVAFEVLESVGVYIGSSRTLENYNQLDPLGVN